MDVIRTYASELDVAVRQLAERLGALTGMDDYSSGRVAVSVENGLPVELERSRKQQERTLFRLRRGTRPAPPALLELSEELVAELDVAEGRIELEFREGEFVSVWLHDRTRL